MRHIANVPPRSGSRDTFDGGSENSGPIADRIAAVAGGSGTTLRVEAPHNKAQADVLVEIQGHSKKVLRLAMARGDNNAVVGSG